VQGVLFTCDVPQSLWSVSCRSWWAGLRFLAHVTWSSLASTNVVLAESSDVRASS